MSGNMGDMGDMGDIGDRSVGSSTSGAQFLPFRIDLPFAKEQPRVWVKGPGGWTWQERAEAELEALPLVSVTEWLRHDWSSRWFAWTVLGEFAATGWRSITLTPYPIDPAEVRAEIDALLIASQDERADAMGEIVAQNVDYADCMAYFMALLRITAGSHPKCCLLMHVAGLVGLLAAMHFKRKPGNGQPPRLRPSQVCPALLPAIEVPGHPAFPSGHAAQAMLMALGLEASLPGPRRQALAPALHALAYRIGRNREIAGLHYASDTTAGLELAGKTFELLLDCTSYAEAVTDAQKEWA